jgi:predicted metal-binding protein
MLAIARKWAESQGRALQCEEVSCLSGCAVGLTLLIEHDDASVRLHGIASETELLQVLGEADAVLAGQPSAAVQAHVLSRTDWSQWRD